jgi:perosamine synthetase
VRNLSWWVPQVGAEERALIAEVLDSNYLNDGELTTRFEHALVARIGCKHAVAVTSGTTAIFLALAGLGIGHGDEVIVPDVTFIATANAVTMTGARPVLVDVDAATLNMDPDALVRAITPRTKAVVPVHVSGRAADLPSILEIARQHGLDVVEDAAEAFMSRANGRCLGTFGVAGCISFSPNKTITTGQGGAVITNDDKLNNRLRELKDQGRPVRGTGGDDVHYSIGYNFKFTNLQAAIGLGQLHYLDSRLARMQDIYRWYSRGLGGIDGISLPGFNLERGESPQWTDAFVDRRDELDRFLAENGIHCRRFWFPIHTQVPYRLADNAFPNSTRMTRKALWLPSAFTLSEDDIAAVCQHVREFLEARVAVRVRESRSTT